MRAGGHTRPEGPAAAAAAVRADMSVRRVAHDFPAARAVFRRFGEEDDRPVFGHLESLAGFARRRGVALEALYAELERAGLAVDRGDARDELVHRPFLAAALAVTLTLGVGWGALLLTDIGRAGAFGAASPAHVVAHGTAQLFGFVAVFVVGVALRYLPAATGRPPLPRALRRALLALLLGGALAQVAWAAWPARLPHLGSAGGAALGAAGVLYLVHALRALAGRLAETWARGVVATAAWLCVWAGWTAFAAAAAGAAGPAAFDGAERSLSLELGLFGLAVGSVYAFGQKLLPGFLSTGRPRRTWFEAAFLLHHLGLALLAAGRTTARPWLAAAGLAGLTCAAVAFVGALRGLRSRVPSARPSQGHPALRAYLRIAFAWLVAMLLASTALAILEAARGAPAPHALIGAVRHGLTVGFLVTLIAGVAQRLLPVLGRTPLAWPALVVPALVLLAAGNALRVAGQAATLAWPPAFRVLPFSALCELFALLLVSANVLRTLWPPPEPLLRTGRVAARTRLSTLLDVHPWMEDVLIEWGFDYVLRIRQVPPEVTLESFAATHGLAAESLVRRIQDALDQRS